MRTSAITFKQTYRVKNHPIFSVAALVSQTEYRIRMAQIIIAACGVLALVYASNLYSIISTTVALQELQTESRTLTASAEELDSEYLRLSSAITPDTLTSYGLKKGEVSFFIPRSNSLGLVVLGGHEL